MYISTVLARAAFEARCVREPSESPLGCWRAGRGAGSRAFRDTARSVLSCSCKTHTNKPREAVSLARQGRGEGAETFQLHHHPIVFPSGELPSATLHAAAGGRAAHWQPTGEKGPKRVASPSRSPVTSPCPRAGRPEPRPSSLGRTIKRAGSEDTRPREHSLGRRVVPDGSAAAEGMAQPGCDTGNTGTAQGLV